MIRIVARIFVAVIVLYLVSKLFLGNNGMVRQYQVHQENTDLRKRIDSLQSVLETLHQENQRLKNDSFYIETIARTQYGMHRKGEKLFLFIENQDDSLESTKVQPPTTPAVSK